MRSFVGHSVAGSGLIDWYFRRYQPDPHWQARIEQVVSCPDNAFIERVPGAGTITRGTQLMHNGLLIGAGSYYGPENGVLLRRNRGVHEPQEERIFQMVLKDCPPGSTMLELGAFWSFYSMWFKSAVTDSRCILLEAEAFNLKSGQKNFARNGFTGEWLHAFAGGKVDLASVPPMLTVDHIMREKGIERLDILHSDIQGFESDMLAGANDALATGRVRYVFISTHSNELHRDCEARLTAHGYVILSSLDLDDTFSEDGVIVARHPSYAGIGPVECSRRSRMPASAV